VCVYHPNRFFAASDRYRDIPVRLLPKSGRFDALFVPRLARVLVSERIDILHSFLLAPSAWALAAKYLAPRRVRFVTSERSAIESDLRSWTAVRRVVYPRSDLVIANSERAARTLVERFPVHPERVAAVPNGIDVAHFAEAVSPAPVVEDALARLPRGATIFTLVGSFHRWKDHMTLVRALGRLRAAGRRDFGVLLAGTPAEPGVQAAVLDAVEREGLGPHVAVIEAVPDVRAIYARVDALVLTSLFEGFPNVVLEAMAAGLPVIASDVSDLPGILGDGERGAVFPVGDDAALAIALRRLLDTPAERRREMGRAAQALTRDRYSMERMVQSTCACYERLGRP
jgi:glycosyltransferase involved in cell wall biosynthesis